MDVADLIKISHVKSILVKPPHSKQVEASLSMTGHHLILTPKHDAKEIQVGWSSISNITYTSCLFQVLHRNIDSIDKRGGDFLVVKTKTMMIFLMDFKGQVDQLINVAESLEKLSAIGEITRLIFTVFIAQAPIRISSMISDFRSYPFIYKPDFKILEDGWSTFQVEIEYSKLIHAFDSEWRISYVNKDFMVDYMMKQWQ